MRTGVSPILAKTLIGVGACVGIGIAVTLFVTIMRIRSGDQEGASSGALGNSEGLMKQDSQRNASDVGAVDEHELLLQTPLVDFELCGEGAWEPPPRDEMRRVVYSNTRFGDGTAPRPSLYPLELARVHYMPVPQAVSANVDIVAMGAFWYNPGGSGGSQQVDQPACGNPPVSRFGDHARALFLTDMGATEMRQDSARLVISVSPAPGTRKFYLIPPAPSSARQTIDVLGADAKPIYHSDESSEWQMDPDGHVQYVLLKLGSTTPTSVPGGAAVVSFRIFGDAGSRPSRLIVLDADGHRRTVGLNGPDDLWAELGSVVLEGDSRLSFEGSGRLLLLRSDLPIP